jgi:hypothetical protein
MKIEELFARTDRYDTVLDMTPALADEFLTRCNTHNRPMCDSHAENLASEMRAGRWRMIHQGIAFSTNRVLLDGQHRLWAVMLSGVTVKMRVFFNEQPDGMMVIDTGRKRTNDQLMTLEGGLGHVTRMEVATLRALVAGLGVYRRGSAGDELELMVKHREAIAFAEQVLSGKRNYKGVATCVTRAVLARAWYSSDRAKLRHFADVLQLGVPLGENDQPTIMLFQFLIHNCGKKARPEMREHYGKAERALSAFLKGERLVKLYASQDELFPLPDETKPAKTEEKK